MQLLSIRSSDIAFTMGAKGPLLEKAAHFDGEIPLFWERGHEDKMKDLIVYVHGKGGSAGEAEYYKTLFSNKDLITIPKRLGRQRKSFSLFLPKRKSNASSSLW